MEDGERTYNDATIYLVNEDRLAPGSRGVVRVRPHFPDKWADLVPGSVVELCEGYRIVGLATVTNLFPSP